MFEVRKGMFADTTEVNIQAVLSSAKEIMSTYFFLLNTGSACEMLLDLNCCVEKQTRKFAPFSLAPLKSAVLFCMELWYIGVSKTNKSPSYILR